MPRMRAIRHLLYEDASGYGWRKASKYERSKIGGYGEYLSEDDVAYFEEQLAKFEYWEKLDKSVSKDGLCYAPPNTILGHLRLGALPRW